jgi:low temperature requirement protein LtrA
MDLISLPGRLGGWVTKIVQGAAGKKDGKFVSFVYFVSFVSTHFFYFVYFVLFVYFCRIQDRFRHSETE